MSRSAVKKLLALAVALRSELAELRAENEKLRAQVRELAAQLKANSWNSLKLPWADGLATPSPKLLRGKTGRKPGGQPGHPGRTLTQVPDPDEVIVHEPGCCGGGGADARAGCRTVTGRQQVLELPPGQVRVTEHQIVTRGCGCGQVSTGPGRRTRAVQAASRRPCGLPLRRPVPVHQADRADTGRPVRTTRVRRHRCWHTARAGTDLGAFMAAVQAAIGAIDVAHVDETGPWPGAAGTATTPTWRSPPPQASPLTTTPRNARSAW